MPKKIPELCHESDTLLGTSSSKEDAATPAISAPYSCRPRGKNRHKPTPENWKQAIRKRLRQAGKEYINVTGNVVAERQVRPGCGENCHFVCSQRFSAEQRQNIHDAYWGLSDEMKNNYYWKYTSRHEPKRRRVAKETSKRGCTVHYHFEIRGKMIPVCSRFFLSTLDISSRRIYYFYEHCYDEETSLPRVVKRGKISRPILPELNERLDAIRQHIGSFCSVRLSGSTSKRYLSADLNLTRMYKMYAETVDNPLKSHWYNKVFKEDFNLKFRKPTKAPPIKGESKKVIANIIEGVNPTIDETNVGQVALQGVDRTQNPTFNNSFYDQQHISN